MIAVIFEVEPADGQETVYLDTAAELRPLLDEIEGIISVERFKSLTNPRKVLSLSFFESEDAVTRWRSTAKHRRAQAWGAAAYFAIIACASLTSCATMAYLSATKLLRTAEPPMNRESRQDRHPNQCYRDHRRPYVKVAGTALPKKFPSPKSTRKHQLRGGLLTLERLLRAKSDIHFHLFLISCRL